MDVFFKKIYANVKKSLTTAPFALIILKRDLEGVSCVRLDLHELIASPGKSLPFAFELEPEDLPLDGVLEYRTPIEVRGAVTNHAGLLEARMTIGADMLCQCARCLREFPKELRMEAAAYLTEELQDEDNEDYYLLEDGEADMTEIARDYVILNFEPRLLCKPDCKGLCSKCGKDLNEGPCGCGEDLDPRMAVLGQLLEKE